MSESAKKTGSQLEASPARKDVTLYDKDKIKIHMSMPVTVKVNQSKDVSYDCAPYLMNNTGFPVESAEFTITLNNVRNGGGTKDEILNVQWWDPQTFTPYRTMTFRCGRVEVGEDKKCDPNPLTCSQINCHTTVTNGNGTQTLQNTLSIVSLTYKPTNPTSDIGDGPNIIIG
ncbi:hypothetical protein A9978_19785 [Pseudomonas sp. UMC65]|uniref:hypothetical protein n=1 Tax=unclassified Pseudomonas TaxID=196821 RepID=UPI0016026C95|nr:MULTISPECIES: hypothetical protein [unclassified Pseudomonas]MBB1614683.1 hypothetical protein [Pseudomonas sp. UMC65]MBB1618223.1 hypothetical protein [Pseudomonas sp. UME65]